MKWTLSVCCICLCSLFTFSQNEQRIQELQVKFDSIVTVGDSLFSINKFKEAQKQYELSCAIKPREYQVLDKILLCAKLIELEKINLEADLYFEQKKFADAQKRYRDALVLFPKDTHAIKMLQEIDRLSDK